jgi:hypothetical protein
LCRPNWMDRSLGLFYCGLFSISHSSDRSD